MTERVFRRCGLTKSGFFHKDEVNPGCAEGYFAQRDEAGNFLRWKKNIYSHPPVGTADGGAFTTVEELDGLLEGLRAGRLLSPELSERLFRPHCGFTRPHRHGVRRNGYAFEFIEWEGEVFCMYKEGGDAGVDGMLAYFPGLGITLSMLSNQEGPFWTMYRELQAELFKLHTAR